MAPATVTTLLSPAELSYLHTSLSLDPPARPDGRTSTQFRPLIAETDILPGTNGSARICFADGTEAIVGVKAEVEKTTSKARFARERGETSGQDAEMKDSERKELESKGKGEASWVEMTIEIPGYRDDDALPVFLGSMLSEALVATGDLVDKLYINNRFHWKLYLDVLLISAPLSYPIPLLSLTTHLALLSTNLPLLISEGEEDPMFSDDWAAAPPLYPSSSSLRPPITLLVVAVKDSIIFDPSKEEIAVADTILAISLAAPSGKSAANGLHLLGTRTIDPPARTTNPGLADSENSATNINNEVTQPSKEAQKATSQVHEGVWAPRRGGFKRGLISKVLAMCLGQGGVGEDVLAGLESFRA